MLTRLLAPCLAALAAALPTLPLHAAGALDPLYGSGGRVVTDFDQRPETAAASLLLPDGRLLVLAVRERELGSVLVRYAPDGAVEKLRFMPPGVRGEMLQPQALARQPDGRLLVAGASFAGSGLHPRFFVQRFNADGTPDAGFGRGGRVDADFPAALITASAMKLLVLDGGRIWLLGRINTAAADGGVRAVLLALHADGTPDSAVGAGGQRLLPGLATVNDALVRPEGVVVVGAAGLSNFDPLPPALVIARLDPADGRYDSRFGNAGLTQQPATRGEAFTTVVALPDGRLVAAGNVAGVLAGGLPSPLRLRRFGADGSADATMAEPLLTLPEGVRLAQHEGTLWLAGRTAAGPAADLALWRLTEGGAIDGSFGSNSRVAADFGGNETLVTLQVQADGKPLLLGTRLGSDNGTDLVLARIDPAAVEAQPATSPSMRSTSKSRPRTEPSSVASRSLFQRSSGAPLTYQLLPLSARISP